MSTYTQAHILRITGIEHAAGIIAGTDDDANKLSIIITAREINPELFIVISQNRQHNDALFEAADVHIVMHRSDVPNAEAGIHLRGNFQADHYVQAEKS